MKHSRETYNTVFLLLSSQLCKFTRQGTTIFKKKNQTKFEYVGENILDFQENQRFFNKCYFLWDCVHVCMDVDVSEKAFDYIILQNYLKAVFIHMPWCYNFTLSSYSTTLYRIDIYACKYASRNQHTINNINSMVALWKVFASKHIIMFLVDKLSFFS